MAYWKALEAYWRRPVEAYWSPTVDTRRPVGAYGGLLEPSGPLCPPRSKLGFNHRKVK